VSGSVTSVTEAVNIGRNEGLIRNKRVTSRNKRNKRNKRNSGGIVKWAMFADGVSVLERLEKTTAIFLGGSPLNAAAGWRDTTRERPC
jgi:hypothetical protein